MMDPHFPAYLTMHYSKSSVIKITGQVRRLFELKFIKSKDDMRTPHLIIENLAKHNKELRSILPDFKHTSTPTFITTELWTKKPSTINNLIAVVRVYAQFYGTLELCNNLSKILSVRARNKEESDVILRYLNYEHTIANFNRLVEKLHTCQTYIDAYIFRYFCTRTEDPIWLGDGIPLHTFGYTYMMPFLELSLRFFVFPLTMLEVKTMKWHHTIISGIPNFPISDTVWLYYNTKCRMCMSYPVANAGNSVVRYVHIHIPGTLTLYFHFYLAYASNNKSTRLNIAQHSKHTTDNIVFQKESVKRQASIPWSDVLSCLRTFLYKLGLDPCLYGLVPGQRYEYHSKTEWSIINTYRNTCSMPNTKILSRQLYQANVGLANSQSKKEYNSLDALRTLERSLEVFCLPTDVVYNTILKLRPMEIRIKQELTMDIRRYIISKNTMK